MIKIGDNKYFTLEEIAKMFGRTEVTIKRWLIKHKIKISRPGGKPYIKESDLEGLFFDS